MRLNDWISAGVLAAAAMFIAGCSTTQGVLDSQSLKNIPDHNYIIGPGDNVNIFVWRNEEVSQSVPVRPDGKITTPLVEDLQASGRTPTELARKIEEVLGTYIKDPIVTVIVTGFNGPYDQQIRILGEASSPKALPYKEKMTLLDLLIEVGGLTEYAAGNQTTLVRRINGEEMKYRVRLADLVEDGDISANVHLLPGDIIIIPESWF